MSSVPRCCDTGRPIVVDPGTRRTVCSCTLQRGLPSYLARVPTLPETVYGTGNTMLNSIYKLYGQNPEHIGLVPAVPHPAIPMSAHTIAAHPYGYGYPGFDIHGARRKNATRETTSPLKAWLYSHKKNPYPTKAEKIMLAIVTRMTLTQVSTWFANARRRLKKENRLNGKDDDCLSDISGKDDSIDVDTSSDQLSFPDCDDVIIESGSVLDMGTTGSLDHDRPSQRCVQKLFSPDSRNELYLDRLSSPELSDKGSSNKLVDIDFHGPKSDIISTNEFGAKSTHVMDSPSDVIPVNSMNQTQVSKDTGTLPQPHTKPKIWSIAQMLG